jgi:hypothetical protein
MPDALRAHAGPCGSGRRVDHDLAQRRKPDDMSQHGRDVYSTDESKWWIHKSADGVWVLWSPRELGFDRYKCASHAAAIVFMVLADTREPVQ